VEAYPADRWEAWEEKVAILDVENKLARPEAEWAAYEIIRVGS
jgi:hypothetical protein